VSITLILTLTLTQTLTLRRISISTTIRFVMILSPISAKERVGTLQRERSQSLSIKRAEMYNDPHLTFQPEINEVWVWWITKST
jgi:hypothetical protein